MTREDKITFILEQIQSDANLLKLIRAMLTQNVSNVDDLTLDKACEILNG